jgi:hypothetical protein
MVLRMSRARTRGHRFTGVFKAGDDLGPSKEADQPVARIARKSNSSTTVGRLPSPVPAPTPSIEPRNGIVVVLLTTLSFLAIALAISAIVKTRFTMPQPGDIPGLHINYWIPPIAAAIGYLLLQCATRYVGAMRPSWRTIAKRAAGDYLLLGLFILVIYIHFNIKMWIPVINPRLYDQD